MAYNEIYPNKIYVHRTIHLGLLSGEETDITGSDVEYIRKDALLEWAKKELESAKMTNFDEFGSGEVITWKCVFDKLNSM